MLAASLWANLERQGRWHDLIATESAALQAARTLTDDYGQTVARHALGTVNLQLGRYKSALREFTRALELCRSSDRTSESCSDEA
jgi:Flp pilus assembly protein TadD